MSKAGKEGWRSLGDILHPLRFVRKKFSAPSVRAGIEMANQSANRPVILIVEEDDDGGVAGAGSEALFTQR